MGGAVRCKAVGAALACLMLCGVLFAIPGRADVGVRPILPGGSSLQPEEETPVQMLRERVEMSVRAATEADNAIIRLNPQAYGLQTQLVWFSAVADVQADFAMLNPTSKVVSLTVWFPLASALENVDWELNPDEIPPRIEAFQVTVNGRQVEYAVNELPSPKGADRPPLPWASFPVSFPAGEETHIQVRYAVPLQPAVKGSELALYYIFQTGAGWAGSIGQAELVVNLPYPASVETLAIASPGSLSVPYGSPKTLKGLPAGTVLEGNQARWVWKDFEPGAQDDFAAWLIDISGWQKLQAALAKVQAQPSDGRAWLELAGIYRSLATVGFNSPSVFSASYLPPGIQAYRRAAELLPEHPSPHAGIALLTLAPYMKEKNAPPEVMQVVQDELHLTRQLESRNSSLAEEAGLTSLIVEDILGMYAYNAATATAEAAVWSTQYAGETETASLTLTPPPALATQTPLPSQTPELAPTETAVDAPAPTATPLLAAQGGFPKLGVWIGLIGLFVIVVVAFLIRRRR